MWLSLKHVVTSGVSTNNSVGSGYKTGRTVTLVTFPV
jgi:hypothetical protein